MKYYYIHRVAIAHPPPEKLLAVVIKQRATCRQHAYLETSEHSGLNWMPVLNPSLQGSDPCRRVGRKVVNILKSMVALNKKTPIPVLALILRVIWPRSVRTLSPLKATLLCLVCFKGTVYLLLINAGNVNSLTQPLTLRSAKMFSTWKRMQLKKTIYSLKFLNKSVKINRWIYKWNQHLLALYYGNYTEPQNSRLEPSIYDLN